MNPTGNHEVVGSIPGLAQGVNDLACLCGSIGLISSPEQWVKGSGVTTVAGLETSICHSTAIKNKKPNQTNSKALDLEWI